MDLCLPQMGSPGKLILDERISRVYIKAPSPIDVTCQGDTAVSRLTKPHEAPPVAARRQALDWALLNAAVGQRQDLVAVRPIFLTFGSASSGPELSSTQSLLTLG